MESEQTQPEAMTKQKNPRRVEAGRKSAAARMKKKIEQALRAEKAKRFPEQTPPKVEYEEAPQALKKKPEVDWVYVLGGVVGVAGLLYIENRSAQLPSMRAPQPCKRQLDTREPETYTKWDPHDM